MSLRIRTGDPVVVLKGKDRGKTGKVLKVFLSTNRAIVEGVNIVKKHMRRRSEQQPSGIVEMPASVHSSNLALWCGHCKKGVRFTIKVLDDKSKIRVCKRCGSSL